MTLYRVTLGLCWADRTWTELEAWVKAEDSAGAEKQATTDYFRFNDETSDVRGESLVHVFTVAIEAVEEREDD